MYILIFIIWFCSKEKNMMGQKKKINWKNITKNHLKTTEWELMWSNIFK